eukprot:Rmarinus@m.8153
MSTVKLSPEEKEKAQKFADGFKIVSMTMRDAATGKIMWETQDWDLSKENVARIPAEILKCQEVSREIVFSSAELIEKFRLVQQVLLHGQPIEEWNFDFGFVIPNSTNSWQQVFVADTNVLPSDILSGNVVIKTFFYNDDLLISSSSVRVFYV